MAAIGALNLVPRPAHKIHGLAPVTPPICSGPWRPAGGPPAGPLTPVFKCAILTFVRVPRSHARFRCLLAEDSLRLVSGVSPGEGLVTVSGSKGESREARRPDPARAGPLV